MKGKSQPLANDFADRFFAFGRYYVTSREARETFCMSADATKLTLNHPERQVCVASPAHGFHVIVTPVATAIDLIGNQDRIRAPDQAVTIPSEFAERVDPERLVAAVNTGFLRTSGQRALNE